jgi:hypothetical protein
MEIPLYTRANFDNAVSEGAFEVKGFHYFTEAIIENELYANNQERAVLDCILRNGTEDLSAEQRMVMHQLLSRYQTSCRNCGKEFTWTEMDPFNQEGLCEECRFTVENGGD